MGMTKFSCNGNFCHNMWSFLREETFEINWYSDVLKLVCMVSMNKAAYFFLYIL